MTDNSSTGPDRPMISVEDLSKVYLLPERKAINLLETEGRDAVRGAGGFLAVDNVSFEVKRGEIFAIMGLSGSGKSTVIRMLNRLIEPTVGKICVDGNDVSALEPPALRELRNKKINMVFQHFALLPHRTLADNVAYGLKVRGVGRRERRSKAMFALEQVGLADRADVLPSALSGGMRQRVGLARALATDAEVLLMDEPFSALDPLIRKDMQNLLLQLQQEFAKTIVFVTHDLNEAMRIGDRIMIMKQGANVQLATGPDLIAQPANQYVDDFVADVDRGKVLKARDALEAPDLVVKVTELPSRALDAAKMSGSATIVVIDANGVLVGMTTTADLAAAASRADHDLAGCVQAHCGAVDEATCLVDVIPRVRRDGAVPVVDELNRLVGIASPLSLLDVLAPDTTTPSVPGLTSTTAAVTHHA